MIFEFTVTDRLMKTSGNVYFDVNGAVLTSVKRMAAAIDLELTDKQLIYIAYIAGLDVPEQLFRMVDLDCWERGEGKTTAEALALLCLPCNPEDDEEMPTFFAPKGSTVQTFIDTINNIYSQINDFNIVCPFEGIEAKIRKATDGERTLTIDFGDDSTEVDIVLIDNVDLKDYVTCKSVIL